MNRRSSFRLPPGLAIVAALLVGVLGGCGAATPVQPVQSPPIVRFAPPAALAVLGLSADAIEPGMSLLRYPKALSQELTPFLLTRLGADLSQASGAVLYVTSVMPPRAAVFLRLQTDKALVGERLGTHAGVDYVAWSDDGEMVAARLDDGLLIGHPESVTQGIDASLGKTQSSQVNARLEQAMHERQLDALLTIDIAAVPDSEQAAIAEFGALGITLSFDKQRKLTVRVHGQSAQQAETLRTMVDMLLKSTVEESRRTKEDAKSDNDTLWAALQIVGYHHLKDIDTRMERRLVSTDLLLSYRFQEEHTLTQWALLAAYLAGIMSTAEAGDDAETPPGDTNQPLQQTSAAWGPRKTEIRKSAD